MRESFGKKERPILDDGHIPVIAISFDDGDETFGEKIKPKSRLAIKNIAKSEEDHDEDEAKDMMLDDG